eukprot:scaffold978_cov122-Skeletonema_dohrnii-CCMP3373.AAC.5
MVSKTFNEVSACRSSKAMTEPSEPQNQKRRLTISAVWADEVGEEVVRSKKSGGKASAEKVPLARKTGAFGYFGFGFYPLKYPRYRGPWMVDGTQFDKNHDAPAACSCYITIYRGNTAHTYT